MVLNGRQHKAMMVECRKGLRLRLLGGERPFERTSSSACASGVAPSEHSCLCFDTIVLALIAAIVAFCLAAIPIGVERAWADAEHNQVASESAMAAKRVITLPGMVPVTADQIRDGVYEIEAESTSSFFKIYGAKLTVKNGKMTADITIRSSSYPLVYMGTGAQAAAAPASDYIAYNSEAETFTIPVEALDTAIDCTAFSKRRHKWYDRQICFYAATLPPGALLIELPEYGELDPNASGTVAHTVREVASGTVGVAGGTAEAVAVDKPDGEYSIEVNMTGGSGRASVRSPTWLIVQNGRAYARLLWSSSYYDYMIVDEVKYLNKTDDGSNSTFIIPITSMDEEIPVVADTTAMGDPVEIEYQLTFYSDTIGDKDLIPQEAAIKVLELAIAIIVVGGIANYYLKKRRKQ